MNKITSNISFKYRKLPILNSTIFKVCSTNNKDEVLEVTKKPDDAFPEEPTTCCMSGCANCVWIAYAEELTKHFQDGGDEAQKQIMEKITDPNLRMFLLTELKCICK
ncbi:oxidoreductase-like domain-containing protein 1 [Chrysoperla carnea]|uniref:oxidoreductase-like domain-containing protein 1 n=1 Tax=Chrysoperla carnea TaxID=189513 RepID=UPI001D0696BC|nr:oxidoreductase-like domain-containing protein 1 [Chrysoperla carnea]